MTVFVRHVQTPYNTKGLVRGHHDPPPTAEGRLMAEATAEQFRGLPIDEIYSTDRQAGSYLAECLSDTTGADLTLTPALRSWNLGELQGQPIDQVQEQIRQYMREPDQVVPGGESWNQFTHKFLDFFVPHWKRRAYCVFVTHGRPIMVARAWLSAGAEGDKLDGQVLDADYSTFVRHGGWVTAAGDRVLDGVR